MGLINNIRKTEKEISQLQAKMKNLEKQKVPTEEYAEIQKHLAAAQRKYDSLLARQEQMRALGKTSGSAWRSLQYQLEEIGRAIRADQADMRELVAQGKAFQSGKMSAEYQKAADRVQVLNDRLAVTRRRLDEVVKRQKDSTKAWQTIRRAAQGMLKTLNSLNRRANTFFKNFLKGSKDVEKSNRRMQFGFKKMLLYSIGYSSVFSLLFKAAQGITEAFTNLTEASDEYASSVKQLKASMMTLGNSFAAAFAPIIQAAVPYLVELINWVNRALTAIGQLFAYLTGKNVFLKAKDVQAGYNDELEETEKAAKKAAKSLAYFDDLHVIQKDDDSGSGGGANAGDMFEEVPIDEDIKKFGDAVKKIMKEFFDPLKGAWDRKGSFVMTAWKYALQEVWALAKDIGRDFIDVWNEVETEDMLADILHIIGDIGLIIGNLARNFREAWNENHTGKKILQDIRDILATIISHIKNAADATVNWADKLDFKPLLTAFEEFLKSAVPAVDSLAGIMEDFYTMVLLPLAKWTIEEGLPELFRILKDFLNKIDWEKLRTNFETLWKKLEPFAETVGEGLLLFIERLTNLVADFVNSDAFMKFLEDLGNWMEEVTPEDVADGIEAFAKALIGLKLAIFGLNAVIAASGLATFVKNAQKLKEMFAGFSFKNLAIGTGATAGIFSLFKKGSQNGNYNDAIQKYVDQIQELDEKLSNGQISTDEYNQKIQELNDTLANADAEYKGVDPEKYKEGAQALEDFSNKYAEALDSNRIKREEAKKDGEKMLDDLAAAFSETFDNIKAYWSEKWDGVSLWFETNVAPWFTKEKWQALWEDVKLAFSTKWEELVAWWSESAIVTWWNESVAPWFTQEKWMELWENIKLAFSTKWEELVEWWNESAIVVWWEENVAPWFTKEKWLELLENIKLAFEEAWENVKEVTAEKIKGLQDKVDELKKKFDELKKNVKDNFDKIKEKIFEVMDPVIEKIQSFIDKIKDAIQTVKDFFASGFEKVAGWVEGGIDFITGRSAEVAAYAVKPDIPQLASGAVIRGGNPFLAVLGDQPAGRTNIEAPLATIEEAMRNVVDGMGGNFESGNRTYVIPLEVNGQEFARLTLSDFMDEMKREGLNVEILEGG